MEFAAQDNHLKNFLAGLINRQTKQILADVYANSHSKSVTSEPSPHTDDQTTSPGFLGTRLDAMVPGIFERKYELDSLCAFLKLSRSYFEKTADKSPFDADWIRAVALVIDTIVDQQKSSEDDPDPIYQFQRQALEPTDTLLHAVGAPAAHTGMSKSAFRPSDDATTFPFLVPANAMAVVELRKVATLLTLLQQHELALKSTGLADEIDKGIETHGGSSTAFSYEVDGFGNRLFMDDANVPSLLSLPYLGYMSLDDPKYQRTRAMILSTKTNPYFFNGTAGQGVGGPHVGLNRIWPMSIMIRALTTDDDEEISDCLDMLKASSAGTGFMHESFSKDNVNVYSRSWFAWANSLFGELILDLTTRKPHLIFR